MNYIDPWFLVGTLAFAGLIVWLHYRMEALLKLVRHLTKQTIIQSELNEQFQLTMIALTLQNESDPERIKELETRIDESKDRLQSIKQQKEKHRETYSID